MTAGTTQAGKSFALELGRPQAGERDALNKPSPQRKLGSMLLFEMDSSFRWNDENRLIQRFQSFALELGRPQAGESSICQITVAHGVSSQSCAGDRKSWV